MQCGFDFVLFMTNTADLTVFFVNLWAVLKKIKGYKNTKKPGLQTKSSVQTTCYSNYDQIQQHGILS